MEFKRRPPGLRFFPVQGSPGRGIVLFGGTLALH